MPETLPDPLPPHGPAADETARYFASAQSWAADRIDALERARRTAWLVAACALGAAVLLVVAIIIMLPLKRTEPLTLLVDRQTGYVQALRPLDPQLVSSEAALTQSFLAQYVIAREGFDAVSLASDYRKVGLWSAGTARRDYVTLMQPANPGSPLAQLPRSAIVDVTVKGISVIGPRTALVRFERRRRDVGGGGSVPQSFAAVIRYRYSTEAMSVDDRLINPLGFEVVHYRRNAELPDRAAPAMSDAPATSDAPDGGAAAAPAAATGLVGQAVTAPTRRPSTVPAP